MRRTRLFACCALLVGVGLAVGAPLPDFPPLPIDQPLREADRIQRLAAVEPGRSPDQVRQLIGAPQSVSRQILYHRCLEQWLYDAPFSVRLEFDCPRGQEPRLLSVQPLDAVKP